MGTFIYYQNVVNHNQLSVHVDSLHDANENRKLVKFSLAQRSMSLIILFLFSNVKRFEHVYVKALYMYQYVCMY